MLFSLQTLYLIMSTGIAIGIWLQILLLKQNSGKIPDTPLFYWLSLADSAWVLISAAALYFLEFDRLAISVPIVYGIYTFLGFFYTAKSVKNSGTPAQIEDVVFDPAHIRFTQSFALTFFLLCLFVLLSPYHKILVNP